MRSVACGPTTWTPSVSSVVASAMTFAKPSYSPPMIALAIAWNGTLPILAVWPFSLACAAVSPIEAISGRQYVARLAVVIEVVDVDVASDRVDRRQTLMARGMSQ